VMKTLVNAVNDFRGTYNVSDYRWFNLRDGDSTSANFQQQYGLMTDEYKQKPAFARYRSLIAQLSIRKKTRQRRLRLRVSCRRDGRWLASAHGSAKGVRRVDFLIDGHRVATDRRPPFRRVLKPPERGRHRVAIKVVTSKGLRYRVRRRLRVCSNRNPA
jgi:hypothetical protein